MPNQFCRYLSNGYSFSISKGTTEVTPCCLFPIPIIADQSMIRNRQNLFENINGWTDSCKTCKQLEDAGQQSLRQSSFDWISAEESSHEPITIDINLDYECNAACVICNKHSSSLWSKELSKLENNKTIIIKKDDQAINRAIDQIISLVSLQRLKYVKFFGGEPLFTDTHLKFIKHIPHPENVTLHYTTNGSVHPNQETLDAWAGFKTVIFAASLDGIEEQFDYVRWPLPWSKVSENILRLRNNSDVWNVMFRIEFTVNFLNAYYYDRVEQWVADNLATNLYGDATEINVHQCWAGIWDLDKMPEKMRQVVMQKYPKTHLIHQLVVNLPKPSDLEPWKKFVDTWDQRRNNSWKTAFPDLVDHL